MEPSTFRSKPRRITPQNTAEDLIELGEQFSRIIRCSKRSFQIRIVCPQVGLSPFEEPRSDQDQQNSRPRETERIDQEGIDGFQNSDGESLELDKRGKFVCCYWRNYGRLIIVGLIIGGLNIEG